MIKFNSPIIIEKEWPDFKKVIDGTDKALQLQYENDTSGYSIFAIDDIVAYRTFIYLDTQEPVGWTPTQVSNNASYRTDFENNWKAGANKQLLVESILYDKNGNQFGTNDNPLVTSTKTATVSGTGASRIAALVPILTSVQPFNKDTILMTEKIVGSASSSFVTNEALVSMVVSAASGDMVIRQSRYYIPFPPGASVVSFQNIILGSAVANVTKRVGLFDSDNGYFIEQTIAGLFIVRRSKVTGIVVDTAIAQTDWNIDTLDGNGVSGVTIDVTKTQTVVVDLSNGICRVGFVINGAIIHGHEFIINNLLSDIGLAVKALPVRFEIVNTAGSVGATLKQSSASVFGDFNIKDFGFVASANTEFGTRTAPAGSDFPLVSVRLKSTHIRGLLYPIFFDLLTTQARDLRARIVIGGTLTNGTWSSVSAAAEANIGASALSGGTTIWTSYLDATISGKSENIISTLLASSDIDGVPEPLTLMVGSLSSTATVAGGLNWKEIA